MGTRSKLDKARTLLFEELFAAFMVDSYYELLNKLQCDGFVSDEVESFQQVPDGDLIRALNSKREAA